MSSQLPNVPKETSWYYEGRQSRLLSSWSGHISAISIIHAVIITDALMITLLMTEARSSTHQTSAVDTVCSVRRVCYTAARSSHSWATVKWETENWATGKFGNGKFGNHFLVGSAKSATVKLATVNWAAVMRATIA